MSSNLPFNVDVALNESGVYYLSGHIGKETIDPLVKWILTHNLLKKQKSLDLIINSPGGSLTDMFAAVDIIEGSNIPITTIGIGLIASAAFAIFITGKKGKRILTPNTSILSHQYTWGSYGKHHELLAATEEFKNSHNRMVAHYKKHTKLSAEQINKFLLPAENKWLTATQAKKLGICDKVATFDWR